ncbi:uncharacterized protein [Glycine max]|uniref:uncharacterized protein n=1 Tax=Glycine max TaxID=3847 RepID=UPI000E21B631|nr:uncharacterized protein LOC113002158 [Glycine max]|eukprot:XP_025984901.1 uncharacterized protein LOC113002158 [Glycine max]
MTPKYLGPYQILKKVGPVAYQIALPPSLSNFHPVFHVSQLRRYNPDPSHVLALDEVQVKDNLTYKAQPQKITDRRMKSLRGKEIALVKVQWGPDEGDSTWKLEDRVNDDLCKENLQLAGDLLNSFYCHAAIRWLAAS